MDSTNKKIMHLGVFISLFMFSMWVFRPLVSPYVELILNNSELYGLPAGMWLGILAAMGPLVVILGTHVMGSFADEVGRRRVVLAGLVCVIFALLLYLIASGPFVLMLAGGLSALGYATVYITSLAKVNDLTEDKKRGSVQGWYLSIQYLGNMIGPLAGTWIAIRFGLRATLVFSMMIILVLSLQLALGKPDRFTPQHRGSFSLLENWKKFLGFKTLKGMAILGVTMHSDTSLKVFFLPLLILQKFPGRIDYVGYAAFCSFVFQPLQFVFGRMVDTMGKRRLTVLGCIISGFSLLLIPVTDSFLSLIGALLLFSAGGALWNVGAWTVMSSIGEANHIEGHVAGSFTSIAKVGHLVASLLFGFLIAYVGLPGLFTIGGYIVLVGVLLSLPFLRDQSLKASKSS
ncbi:MFS transporter [Candidatus Woesearchaeota archaeon]|nr:MFS transporter [Candidatus Woesearchaeota archaeon]